MNGLDYNIEFDLKEQRKDFSKIGFSLTSMLLAPNALVFYITFVWVIILELMGKPGTVMDINVLSILSSVFIYAVGLPIGYVIISKIPVTPPKKAKLSLNNFFVFLVMCIAIMNIGDLVGTGLSALLSGAKAQNPLDIMNSMNIFTIFLTTVIIAPIGEEFIFRKLIIDRTLKYGEMTAIIFSGLTFGLFHQNFFQFFYAFGVGVLFAYIYVRTGKIRYSMIMHAVINFIGGIIPFILSKSFLEVYGTVPEEVTEISKEFLSDSIATMGSMAIYYMVNIILTVVGAVFLILNLRKFCFEKTSLEIPKKKVFKTVYVNAGMIVFFILVMNLLIL